MGRKESNQTNKHTPLLDLSVRLKSDIEIVQIGLFFYWTNHWKLVDRLIASIFMIWKVNLGVGEMGFMFCDL